MAVVSGEGNGSALEKIFVVFCVYQCVGKIGLLDESSRLSQSGLLPLFGGTFAGVSV